MSLDLAKLEQKRERGGKLEARCPACAENGADVTGNHLFILDSGLGKWGCVVNTGDAGKEHRRRIAQLAGAGDSTASARPFIPRPIVKPTCKPAKPLPALRTPTPEELHQIAASRGHCADGMTILVERGMLFTSDVWDDGKTWPAWVAADPSRTNAQARKMDRGVWTGIGGAKAKSLPSTTATRCIGAAIIGNRPEVWLVEGTPDLIAAPVAAKLGGLNLNQIAFVCITGTGNSLHADDLPHFTGKRIVIAVHNDTEHGKGAKAAHGWANQLYKAGAREVVGFDFSKHRCKDLSEYVANLAPCAPMPPHEGESPLKAKETTPEGLCPECWARRIAAPINGPTCACKPFICPTWTPEQLAADTWAEGRE